MLLLYNILYLSALLDCTRPQGLMQEGGQPTEVYKGVPNSGFFLKLNFKNNDGISLIRAYFFLYAMLFESSLKEMSKG